MFLAAETYATAFEIGEREAGMSLGLAHPADNNAGVAVANPRGNPRGQRRYTTQKCQRRLQQLQRSSSAFTEPGLFFCTRPSSSGQTFVLPSNSVESMNVTIVG